MKPGALAPLHQLGGERDRQPLRVAHDGCSAIRRSRAALDHRRAAQARAGGQGHEGARAGQQRLARQVLGRQPGGRRPARASTTRVGNETASSAPTNPPIELPITTGSSSPSWSQTRVDGAARSPGSRLVRGISDRPKPGRSIATQRCVSMKAGMLSSQFCQMPPRPWMNSSGGPSPPVSITPTRGRRPRAGASSTASRRPSTSCRRRPRRWGPGRGGRLRCGPWLGHPGRRSARRSRVEVPCASPSTSTPRCTTTGTSSRRSPSGASASTCPTRSSSRGGSPAAARAGPRLRRRDPPRGARARRRAVPGRGRDDPRAGTRPGTSSTSPRTARPRRTTPPSAGSSGSACRTTSSTARSTRSPAAARSASTS